MFGVSLRGFLEEFHTWTLVFQRNAWFDCGFMLMRQTTEAGFCWCLYSSRCALFLLGRPMKLGIMAGMPSEIVMCLAAACTRLVLLVAKHLALCSLG